MMVTENQQEDGRQSDCDGYREPTRRQETIRMQCLQGTSPRTVDNQNVMVSWQDGVTMLLRWRVAISSHIYYVICYGSNKGGRSKTSQRRIDIVIGSRVNVAGV